MVRNCELIRRIHRIAREFEMQIMAPKELRPLLDLEDGSVKFGLKMQSVDLI